MADAISGVQRDVNALLGNLSAAEWLLKLAPAGVPVGGGRVLTKTLYGTLLYLDEKDRLITPHLLLNRVFEPEVSQLAETLVRPGDTVVDVGANIGYYTCSFGRCVGPTGRVLAFEADPNICGLLRDNIMINNIFGWTSYSNVAISSKQGTLKMYRRILFQGNTSIIRVPPAILSAYGDTDEEFEIPCASLDNLLHEYDRPIALIKIDVEGSERLVLEGMRGLVERNPGIRIILEWALWTIRDSGSTPEEMWDLLRGMDLRVFKIGQTVEAIDLPQLAGTEICYLLLER